MIRFSKGSYVHRLATLLSFVGEFPVCSLSLIGRERVIKELVHRLTTVQTFRDDVTGEELTCRMLSVTGKGAAKTIRLYKPALQMLHWIDPGAYGYYMDSFWNHKFPGDAAHRERHHRVAESAALCMNAGLEVVPYHLPALQNQRIKHIVPECAVFYLAKDMKKIDIDEMNKTMFTRMTGAVFSGENCYAVYNARGSAMKWKGKGEFKALHGLSDIARMNAGIDLIDEAVLIGTDEDTALRTLISSDASRKHEFRFDAVYRHIYFIRMDEVGTRQLRLLILPHWKEMLLSLLFEEEQKAASPGMFEYDAIVEGKYVFSYLDGDLARLIRFRDAVAQVVPHCEVLCFPHQLPFLRSYLGELVGYKTIEMELLEAELGIGGGKSR